MTEEALEQHEEQNGTEEALEQQQEQNGTDEAPQPSRMIMSAASDSLVVEGNMAVILAAGQNANAQASTIVFGTAGQSLALDSSGALMLTAGQDLHVSKSGAGFMFAGGDLTVEHGGAGMLIRIPHRWAVFDRRMRSGLPLSDQPGSVWKKQVDEAGSDHERFLTTREIFAKI